MKANTALKIAPTPFQKSLNIACLIIFICYIAYSLLAWQRLPEMIPKHFNGAGIIDAYWSKNHFFFLPIMSAVTYLTISICEFFPQCWNIPQKKGASPLQNERNLSLAYSMVIWLKLECLIVFWLLTHYTVICRNLPVFFLALTMLIIFATMGYYIYQMYRKKEGENHDYLH